MLIPVYTSLRVFLYEAISRIVLFEIASYLAMTNVVSNKKASKYFNL
jgi:hypothetical protein